MPFDCVLPRIPSFAAAQIGNALDTLLSLMLTPPKCQRIEDDRGYLEQLAGELIAVGRAFEAANLKSAVIGCRSWDTATDQESWARSLIQQGFNSSLDGTRLATWLAQPTLNGARPGGDPDFFFSMRSCLVDFRVRVMQQIQPELEHREGTSKKPKRGSSRRKRGRPVDTDHDADRRLWEAWMSNDYRTYEELAKAKGCTARGVKLTIQRHRKRIKSAESFAPE